MQNGTHNGRPLLELDGSITPKKTVDSESYSIGFGFVGTITITIDGKDFEFNSVSGAVDADGQTGNMWPQPDTSGPTWDGDKQAGVTIRTTPDHIVVIAHSTPVFEDVFTGGDQYEETIAGTVLTVDVGSTPPKEFTVSGDCIFTSMVVSDTRVEYDGSGNATTCPWDPVFPWHYHTLWSFLMAKTANYERTYRGRVSSGERLWFPDLSFLSALTFTDVSDSETCVGNAPLPPHWDYDCEHNYTGVEGACLYDYTEDDDGDISTGDWATCNISGNGTKWSTAPAATSRYLRSAYREDSATQNDNALIASTWACAWYEGFEDITTYTDGDCDTVQGTSYKSGMVRRYDLEGNEAGWGLGSGKNGSTIIAQNRYFQPAHSQATPYPKPEFRIELESSDDGPGTPLDSEVSVNSVAAGFTVDDGAVEWTA